MRWQPAGPASTLPASVLILQSLQSIEHLSRARYSYPRQPDGLCFQVRFFHEHFMHRNGQRAANRLMFLLVGMLVIWGCAGPQSLRTAIRPVDEESYRSAIEKHSETPRQAFYEWKAETTGQAVDEIEQADQSLSTTRNPFDANRDSVAVSRGAVVYKVHCMSCHGENADGRGPAMTAQLPRMDFHAFDKRFAATVHRGAPRAWFRKINDGYVSTIVNADGSTNSMPAFRDVLAREQIWLAVTYLQSLDAYAGKPVAAAR